MVNRKVVKRMALLVAAVVVAACSQMTTTAYKAPMKDGEAVIPADYKSWPKMLSAV